MKRLVLCCDGTWNVADPIEGSPTDIPKIALNVAPAAGGVDQRVFYDPGVGTGRFDRLSGGAFGVGLSENVRQAYRFVVANYDPGDELFLFGFSRGAFTARSTAGLIRNSGILRREHADRVDEAYRLYRSRKEHERPGGIGAQLFRRSFAHEAGVRFLGVFDTVGALGIPSLGGPLAAVLNRPWSFHDTELGPHVQAAFQALAMDEQRGPFEPSLWTRTFPHQTVSQVWFRGVHSDVGGGYPQPDLADVTLRWMVRRAHDEGLRFADGAFVDCVQAGDSDARARGLCAHPDPTGRRHDSRTLAWRMLPAAPRAFGGGADPRPGEAIADVVPKHPDAVPDGFTAALAAGRTTHVDLTWPPP